MQDPTVGGTNMYCGSDNVFQNAQGDTLFRVSTPDGTVYQLNGVTPPSQQQNQPPGNQQQTGRPSSPSTNKPQTPNNPTKGGVAPVNSGAPGSHTLNPTVPGTAPGAAGGAAAVSTAQGFGNWLSGQTCMSQIDNKANQPAQCIPNWALLGGGLALLLLVNRGGRAGRLI